jgi:hypothetical protein
MMLRAATRRAAGLGERIGRTAAQQLQHTSNSGKNLMPLLSTTFRNHHSSASSSYFLDEASYAASQGIPEPMPMVAYDYEDPYDDETDSGSYFSASSSVDVTAGADSSSRDVFSIAGSRGPSARETYPPSSSSSFSSPDGGKTRKFGSRGGGGGRYCCPKCGTSVTFRHGDFDENTFYCANCSGWFVANPNTIMSSSGDDHNKSETYEELMKNGTGSHHHKNTPGGPQILMQHVRYV